MARELCPAHTSTVAAVRSTSIGYHHQPTLSPACSIRPARSLSSSVVGMFVLWKSVATVNDKVQPGRVRGGVGSKVQVRTLELVDLTLTSVTCQLSFLGILNRNTYPMGVLLFHCFFISGSAKCVISVWIYPGETVFTLANPVHSTAKLLQK